MDIEEAGWVWSFKDLDGSVRGYIKIGYDTCIVFSEQRSVENMHRYREFYKTRSDLIYEQVPKEFFYES